MSSYSRKPDTLVNNARNSALFQAKVSIRYLCIRHSLFFRNAPIPFEFRFIMPHLFASLIMANRVDSIGRGRISFWQRGLTQDRIQNYFFSGTLTNKPARCVVLASSAADKSVRYSWNGFFAGFGCNRANFISTANSAN